MIVLYPHHHHHHHHAHVAQLECSVKALIVASVVLAIAGCATATPMAQPDGSLGYFVSCPGGRPDKCANKAAELCGGPYSIIGEQDEQISGAFANRRGSMAFSMPVIHVNVVCGGPSVPNRAQTGIVAPDAATANALGFRNCMDVNHDEAYCGSIFK